MDVELPVRDSAVGRIAFPDVDHLSWDERYQELLKHATWESLRHNVFRFSNFASQIANRCVEFEMKSVLKPSVGICIHPWLFAYRGISAIATDIAPSALAALSEPALMPKVFSWAAYDRWDISQTASHGNIPHWDQFTGMPVLEDEHVRRSLCGRIRFVRADWGDLPVASASVDIVFATNALPRESSIERMRVLQEWQRLIKPGGLIFIAQHHAGSDWNIESFFLALGWCKADILRGQRPGEKVNGGFQTYYSSG